MSRHKSFRLIAGDQADLNSLARQGKHAGSCSRTLGVSEIAVNTLLFGGLGSESVVDTVGAALADWRARQRRGA